MVVLRCLRLLRHVGRCLPWGLVLAVLGSAAAPCRAISPALSDQFLKTDGRVLRNGRGQVVALRGTNLGSWLLMEPWMCPMDSSWLKDHRSALDTLTQRFGPAAAEELVNVYQDHWITAQDLDNITALHLNVVRLPFWYRNVQSESGTWRGEPFRRLDWLVGKAWERHIYTIIDLHGVPGGQATVMTTGAARKAAEFWTSDADQQRTVEIWQRVATHFKGNPAVAAYDLINEPMGAPTRPALWAMYDRLYRTVRAIDPDHIITVEGCWAGKVDKGFVGWGWNALPPPTEFGWTNILYQLHSYDFVHWNNTEAQSRNTQSQIDDCKAHQKWNVPCFIGEFSVMNPQPDPARVWTQTLQSFDANGMSWAQWAYKDSHHGNWGIYIPKEKIAVPNLQKDSAADIRAKWSQLDTAASFILNPVLQQAIAGATRADPNAPK